MNKIATLYKNFKQISNLQIQINRGLNTKIKNEFFFKKKEPQFDLQKQKQKELNESYQKFLENQRYNIRQPYEKDFFLTDEIKQKQLTEAQEAFKEYQDVHKLDQHVQSKPFISMLSKVSYCYEYKKIVEKEEFQKLIIATAEQCYDFDDLDNFINFVNFCSIVEIPNIQTVWETFSSYILNNLSLFNFRQRISILSSINDRNYEQFGQFFDVFEVQFLEDIMISKEKVDLQRVYEILTIYRKYEKGNENFYFTIQEKIKDNIKETSIPILVQFILHYSNSVKESIENRTQMMSLFEEIILKKIKFLNNDEILKVMFCYTKFGKGSDLFFEALDDRVLLLIDQMSIQEVKNILIISQNRKGSRDKIYQAVEAYLRTNINKIQRINLPELFFYFSENMVGSPQFYELMEAKLLEIIFVLNSELLSLCAWSFAVNQHTFKANLFMKKLEEAFPQQIKNSSIKDMSRIVWSMCRTKGPDSPLLDQIEQEINQRQLSGKDCAHVLWGYILNKPLQGKTLEKLVKTILSQKEQLDSWDVSTIIWSFSKYEKHDIFKFIYIELYDQVMEVIDEMNNEELLQVIRSYIETKNETQELVDVSREILQENLLQLSYDQVILCIHLYTSMTQANIDNELKEFIMQLKKRAEEMVRLQVISNDLQKEVDIHSVEYYEKLQKLEELKQ